MIKKNIHFFLQATLLLIGILMLPILISSAARAVAFDEIFYSGNNILFSDPRSLACATSEASASSPINLTGIPDPWGSLIAKTAPKYADTDSRTVAAALFVENRGWPNYNKDWASSSAGAQGPWQFIPSTWASLGTDGDGDGIKDPNNPEDAVHAAFKHMKGSAGKPIITGYSDNIDTGLDLTFTRDRSNLLSFMASYNGSGAPNNTPLKNFPRNENSDYVLMSYYVIASNFLKKWENGSVVDITASSANTASQPLPSSTSSCPPQEGNSEFGSVNTEGFSFPVGLKKGDVAGSWPCAKVCHHSNYYAFDLANKATNDESAGVSVYAIEEGQMKGYKTNYMSNAGCETFQFYGKSGWVYWYGHLENVDKTLINQTVQPGKKLAEIGRRDCTGNGSYPHLHIDRGSPKGNTGGNTGDQSIIPLMNQLYEGLQ